MGGTVKGGLKAAAKNTAKEPNFYKRIGAAGGTKSKGGGFALTGDPKIDADRKELAAAAGRKGGLASRRGQ